MTYHVKEMYATVQGEGVRTGRSAVFCRFSGCNLWSGRDVDRHRAQCRFCDTDFVGVNGIGGGVFGDAGTLALAARRCWYDGDVCSDPPYIVCTGGEPLLQLDDILIEALHDAGFEVAVETNGTCPAPLAVDWLCVSPKAGVDFIQTSGDELKLVWPQPMNLEFLEELDFGHFFLQPMASQSQLHYNIAQARTICLRRPLWRMSLQTHKHWGLR